MASSDTGIPPSWLSETNYTTLRDASFSSYLNSSEENYIRTLINSTHNLNYHLNSNPIKPEKVEDREIDVFSADKYFNGEMDQETNTKVVNHHTEKTVTSLSKLNLQPRTPSIHSESSWNSQSALLRPVLRNPSRRKTNIKEKKSSFLSSCYCCNNKSIDIEEQDQFTNHGNTSFNNNNSSYQREIMTRTIKTSFDTAEITRFNKLRLGSSNTTVDPFTFPVEELCTTGAPNGTYKDDTESDASSDLFEIECLGPGSGTPTTGYEPSEVSVDWSVVTASAANFSALSDSEDQKSTVSTLTSVTGGRTGLKSRSSVKRVVNKGGQLPRSIGMLGGCKSQKAVRVAGDGYSCRTPRHRKSSGESLRIYT